MRTLPVVLPSRILFILLILSNLFLPHLFGPAAGSAGGGAAVERSNTR
jgi:hypothetical protein